MGSFNYTIKPSKICVWDELFGNDIIIKSEEYPLIYDTEYYSDGTPRDIIRDIDIYNKEERLGGIIMERCHLIHLFKSDHNSLRESEFFRHVYLGLLAMEKLLEETPFWHHGCNLYILEANNLKEEYKSNDVFADFYSDLCPVYAKLLISLGLEVFNLHKIQTKLSDYLRSIELEVGYDPLTYGVKVVKEPIFPIIDEEVDS